MTPVLPRGGGIRLLQALLVLSLLFPLTLFAIGSVIAYRAQLGDDRAGLWHVSDIAYEHAEKVFETQELVIRNVGDLIAGMTDAEILADQARLHQELQKRIAALPQIQDLWLIDKDGHDLVSAQTFPIPQGQMATDRSYFQEEKEQAQLFVSELLIGRNHEQRFFNVAMRRPSADGSFNGIIAVSVNLNYFEEFYQRVLAEDAERQYAIVMVRGGGDTLVRYPPAPRGAVPSVSSTFRKETVDHPDRGFYEWTSPSDGLQRMVAYRKLATAPVYVAALLPKSAVVAAWLATMGPHLIFGVPASIALFLVTLTALRRTERETTALALAAQEAERRRTAESALQQSQKMEAVGQLTGGIAHDFNNLLHAILGNLDLVEMATDLDKAKRHAAAAQRATARGERLTSRLLAFSRRQELNAETIDVNALVEEFAALADHAVGKTVRLELALDGSAPRCQSDATQFEAALLNLTINARDALQGGGDPVIRIATRKALLTADDLVGNSDAAPGSFIAVAVSDAGSGMAPDTARRAFEPFFTTKEVGKGTGLGLSQVYGFVHQVGGHVTLETAPGQGTTVTLYLPEAHELPPARVPGAPVPATATPSATILVVDDDPDVRELTEAWLRLAGYRILMARDGKEAIAVLEGEEAIDLLLSDVVMPNGIGGVELARRARALRPGIAVLLMSGYTATELPAASAGEFEMLTKPYLAAGLQARIEALLAAPAGGG